jgi:hypothetical protein
MEHTGPDPATLPCVSAFSNNERVNTSEPSTQPDKKPDEANEAAESLDPNDSDMEWDKLRGHTTVHAKPPRLEDEGQPGG